jgi:Spy/CpxP family protein refolding chaperone
MKTKMLAIAIFTFAFFITNSVFSQPGRRTQDFHPQQRYSERSFDRSERPQRQMLEDCIIPDLTEEQQVQMKELRLARLEKSTQHRNQMDELRARKRNLMTQNDVDNEAINAIIDEMTSLSNVQMKEAVKQRQAVRNILTDEQRVIFDSRNGRRQGGRGSNGRQGDAPRMRRW